MPINYYIYCFAAPSSIQESLGPTVILNMIVWTVVDTSSGYLDVY